MKTIVAGTRTFNDYELLKDMLARFDITEVVSGGARGADALGERWAKERGLPLHRFPADWNRYGKAAGPRRNRLMAENAQALVAFWDGESRGTKHMIDVATELGLEVVIVRIGDLL
jgi:predicted Rossmann fold nucleotide-binding protein DprA/Smf involved in DNA uptake